MDALLLGQMLQHMLNCYWIAGCFGDTDQRYRSKGPRKLMLPVVGQLKAKRQISLDTLTGRFKILAETNPLRIVDLLREEEQCNCEVSCQLEV